VTFEGGSVTGWSGSPILVDASLPDDPAAAQKLTELSKPLEMLKTSVVGKTIAGLDGSKSTVRNRESNLGNLVADAALWSTSRDGTTIALVNGGGMRASIPAGDITMGHVLQALPFGNRLVQFDVTGSDIVSSLENSVSTVDTDPEKSGGRFLQIAGMKFTADMTRAAGSRVADVQIHTSSSGFQPIEKGATYRVVSLDYILNGGDGYTMFKNAKNVRGGDVPLEQAVISYLASKSMVSPSVEGRIILSR
jgi:5'-nucleotidase / UDP-sugar diphosphatase